jgi:hypothetical protein
MSLANLDRQRVSELELLYLGRVLAGQCHELANALNIAHQLCGLHEDTVPRAREGESGCLEKLGSLAQRIETQLSRSDTIVRSLSRFAHAVEEPVVACDAREIMERAVFFAGRQARLRRIELRANLPEGSVRFVDCRPFLLQQAIHAGIELLLEPVAEGRRITATLAFDSAGAVVTLGSAASVRCTETVADLVKAAGGEMRERPEDSSLVFLIRYSQRDGAPMEVSDGK